ncbi:MAG: hypothetical protein G8D28_09095 [gamma proteobacterium symbiont of Phacoides pectinatus]
MGKLRWQCRRGMLELDYALSEFLEALYPALDEEEQRGFVRLLDSLTAMESESKAVSPR